MVQYRKIKRGTFVSRPNRFIAIVEIDGEEHMCHVKNTGRCRELLIKGVTVVLEDCLGAHRKTRYDVIGVYKNKRLINMDSQAPNKVVKEWIEGTDFFGPVTLCKPECKFGNSRIDFYIETETRKILMEVKGVTLEENQVVYFPDAPTERGVKHINELVEATQKGYEAYILFVIQMQGVKKFRPNDVTHKAFGDALRNAINHGVNVLAFDCFVEEDRLQIDKEVEVRV